jgi:hypothetical protein
MPRLVVEHGRSNIKTRACLIVEARDSVGSVMPCKARVSEAKLTWLLSAGIRFFCWKAIGPWITEQLLIKSAVQHA